MVVDLPPAPKALSVLALPEQLRRYLRKLLPPERQAARALRPMLGRLAGVPMPAAWLYETAARWDDDLAAAQAVIEAPTTTVRLVAEPGPAGADALEAAATGLALQGLRTDCLVANRLLPDASADTWLAALQRQQHKTLAAWETAHDHVVRVRHLGHDPRGADDLTALGLPPAPAEPPRPSSGPSPAAPTGEESHAYVWHIPLPGVVREETGADTARRRAGHHRRARPPHRHPAVRPAPLHRRRSRAAQGGAEGALRPRRRSVAPRTVNGPPPFG